jgi:hypothetical protein
MNKLFLIILLTFGTNAFGQLTPQTAKSPSEFIPAGYVIFAEIRGDLNKDSKEDYVFIIKGTDKNKFHKDDYRGELDRNRRGIIIAIRNQDNYELVLDNRECFSSENEDGGVYFAPDLDASIHKGNLILHYAHGRYGYWSYNFRYQNSDFELIGFDSSENYGPIVQRTKSINFMTRKILTKENINRYADGEDEKFKESWRTFTLSKLTKLREIPDFDEFDVERLLGTVE